MLGYDTSGIRSTGSFINEIPPSRRITTQIMNMVIGRWMASRGILISVSLDARRSASGTPAAVRASAGALLCRARAAGRPLAGKNDQVTVLQRQRAGRDHPDAVVESLRDFHPV